MKTDTNYAIFDARESLLQSILTDTTTFAFLSLMIYVSQDSNWWTLVTGIMFLIFVFGKLSVTVHRRHHRFHTKEELQKWVNSLP